MPNHINTILLIIIPLYSQPTIFKEREETLKMDEIVTVVVAFSFAKGIEAPIKL